MDATAVDVRHIEPDLNELHKRVQRCPRCLSRRTISECIALAEAQKESGEEPVLDPDFAADVEEIVRDRKPWNPPTWD